MEYAIIKYKSKQYKVSKDDVIEIDKVDLKPTEKILFKDVLLYCGDGAVVVGKPTVEKALVAGTLLENFKSEKIRVSRFKAKVRYRKVRGFRAALSKVKIEAIDFLIKKPTQKLSKAKKK